MTDSVIAILRSAKAGSDELNEAVYEALGAKPPNWNNPLYWTDPAGASRHYPALVPKYTQSVDVLLHAARDKRELFGIIWRMLLECRAAEEPCDADRFPLIREALIWVLERRGVT